MNPAYEAAGSTRTVWQIEILREGFRFIRLSEGKAAGIYRIADGRVAAVYAAAIIQGYQPPLVLTDQGRLAVLEEEAPEASVGAVVPLGDDADMPPLTSEEARHARRGIGDFVVGESRHVVSIISARSDQAVSIRRSQVPRLIHALKSLLPQSRES